VGHKTAIVHICAILKEKLKSGWGGGSGGLASVNSRSRVESVTPLIACGLELTRWNSMAW